MLAQIVALLSLVLVAGWFTRKYVPALAKPVYLIDTYTYKPPDRMKVSRENYIRGARMRKVCALPLIQKGQQLGGLAIKWQMLRSLRLPYSAACILQPWEEWWEAYSSVRRACTCICGLMSKESSLLFAYSLTEHLIALRRTDMQCVGNLQIWGEEALQFQEKLLNSSGLGDETYFPDSEFPINLQTTQRCTC